MKRMHVGLIISALVSFSVAAGSRLTPFETAVARNIAPGSTAGLPGLVLPVGLTRAGLPVSIEFDAPSGADRALLALGLGVERELETLPAPRKA
jgi:Asp-tRNA(Asn)/Glu-tRNA(Gln) amidotransferase A subunit family amidase